MRAIRSVAVAGVAIAALAASVTAASADPSVQPKTTDIVAVGSDTITPLFTQWSKDYNATTPAKNVYSWDATGSATIQTKGTQAADPNCNITRPNGSSSGISQLVKNALTHDNNQCVDVARSSRALKSTDGHNLSEVALGRDIITISTETASTTATSNFTPTQLKAIYNCDASILGTGHTGVVTFNEVGGVSTDKIVAVLPQSGSGTRSTFLSDIGVTWTTPPAACTVSGVSYLVNGTSSVDGTAIEENEGTNSEFGSSNALAKDIVFPYSAGAYLGETVFHTNPQQPGPLGLEEIDNKSALNTAGNALNISGFDSQFIRTLYAVVIGTTAAPHIPTYLQPFLGTGNTSAPGWICKGSSTTVGTGPYDLAQQGFAPAFICGAITYQS